MSPDKHVRTVSLYRLRMPDDADLRTAVAERYLGRPEYTAAPFTVDGVEALLVTGSVSRERTDWCAPLAELTGLEVDLASQVSSGLVLVRTDRAAYALSYGKGYCLLDPERQDVGFGLSFALRCLDEDSLKLVRRSFMDSRGRTDENSSTRGGTLRDLGTEWIGVLVNRIIGRASNLPLTHASYSRGPTKVSCTDVSVALPLAHTPRDFLRDLAVIEDVCARPAPLPGLEALARVRSLRGRGRTALVRGLDDRLDGLLGADGDVTRSAVALSVPSECADDIDQAQGVRITCGSRTVQAEEVVLDDVLSLVRARRAGRRLPALKQMRIQLFADRECREALTPPVSGARWLTAELHSRDASHFSWQGVWYEVGAEYVELLRKEITELLARPSSVELPYWPVGMDERSYNEERAGKQPGYTHFDRLTVRTSTFRGGGVEICDLLGPEGQLIMVKQAPKGSDGLSHLFAQARVAVEALRYDNDVRDKFLAAVAARGLHHSVEDILVTPTVVLAIRLKKGTPITADSLFPFAQVILLQTVVALQGMGARVEILPLYVDETGAEGRRVA